MDRAMRNSTASRAWRVCLVAGLITVLCLFASPSFAAIYSWLDRGGTRYYTNDPDEVPVEHRAANKLEVYTWTGVDGKRQYTLTKAEVPPRFRREAGITMLYKWVDEKKVVHYAFDLDDVPPRWRNMATKETGEALISAKVDTPTKEELASASARPQAGAAQKQPAVNPFVEALQRAKDRSGAPGPGAATGKPQPANPFVEALKRAKERRQQAAQETQGQEEQPQGSSNPFLDAIRRTRDQ
ncbi:MAG: DUF4124 domain-containing protein [Candidatus Tectomicrobia bacterium]|nr:DUF4124 domain-containing protein [Candidatus Tectomicrobia bacterium]